VDQRDESDPLMTLQNRRIRTTIATLLAWALVFVGCRPSADGTGAETDAQQESAEAETGAEQGASNLGSGTAPTAALDDQLPRDGVPGAAVGTLAREFEVSDDGVAGYQTRAHPAGSERGREDAGSLLGMSGSGLELSDIAGIERTSTCWRTRAASRATAAYNLVYPKRVTLTPNAEGQFEENLRISTRRGDPPKIGKVEDPDGLLDIEVQAAKGPTVTIRLRARADGTAKVDARVRHKLLVHTNDPDEPKLELEYNLGTTPAKRTDRREGVVPKAE
jgi:hypothetical protein